MRATFATLSCAWQWDTKLTSSSILQIPKPLPSIKQATKKFQWKCDKVSHAIKNSNSSFSISSSDKLGHICYFAMSCVPGSETHDKGQGLSWALPKALLRAWDRILATPPRCSPDAHPLGFWPEMCIRRTVGRCCQNSVLRRGRAWRTCPICTSSGGIRAHLLER
jgi:hypothetical protein